VDADFEAIRESLRTLRKSKETPKVFGAEMHKFRTHRPLIEEDVREFERERQVELPSEYRGFLIHVGNGGAGPAYGLFKLGEMDDGFGHGPWGEGFVGDLSEPFPHTGPWNDLSGRPEFDEERADDEEWEDEYNRQLDAWENEHYWTPLDGAIPICHLGCASRQWLVVTGPEAGNVWCDDRADEGGLKPLQREGLERVTFLQWYMHWLDDALRQIR